mgnify:CR=1 FL=1
MAGNHALKDVKDFLRSLDFTKDVPFTLEGGVLFSTTDEDDVTHTIQLTRANSILYRKSVDVLFTEAGGSSLVSRRGAEKWLQQAIVRVSGKPKKWQEFPNDVRISKAISELDRLVNIEPSQYEIQVPVRGLHPFGLPYKIGDVEFNILSEDHLRKFKNIEPLERVIEDIKVVAVVETKAKDSSAAQTNAKQSVRKIIEIINFFSDLIPYSPSWIYLPGDFESAITANILTKLESLEITPTMNCERVGPFGGLNLKLLLENDESRKFGFKQVCTYLSSTPSKLQQLLLAGVRWAGRATVELRPDIKFLLFAIALETVVLLGNKQDELLYRLRIRTAHLLGEGIEERLSMIGDLKDLYNKRSKIVHNGRTDITDEDVYQIWWYSKRTIIRLLTDDNLSGMQTIQELGKWYDKKVLE